MVKEQLFQIGVKAIIRNRQGNILMLKCLLQDYWDLPGGRVQEHENFSDALLREVQEETGLKALENITSRGMYLTPIKIPLETFENGNFAGLILHYHSCLILDDQPIVLSTEHDDFLWAEPEHAKMLLSTNINLKAHPISKIIGMVG
jgi:8-oxo-dGTP pyrophosphatase MutT (NUDIX family)